MASRARKLYSLLLVPLLLLGFSTRAAFADARFDLVGPRIDVRVTRGNQTLPIASVPNLQPGDRLWLHPDLPPTQSVKYLLICVFLRGTTNPPPESWFIRIETWDRKVRQEGVFVTVPKEAQQALLFMAPETGGDFSTLRSAVQGRPGAFVRASQDLTEAGFEEARIEKYLGSIRLVPPSDPASLQKHSDLLSRTLALKPNEACFKQPVDTQFTCLTQSGSQIVLDDGHGQSIISALSTGANSDFIQAASYTGLGGGGVYSAYVGAVVDLVRILGNLHTAQYQYIPAIAFPQDQALNLKLNTPPSFHNPKSVLVISLPSVQAAQPPPLRPADAKQIACLLKPSVVLPIEGAPLVFTTAFAHDLVLHLNVPAGAPAEADIPLIPDAFQGGLVLNRTPEHHVPLPEPKPLLANGKTADTAPAEAKKEEKTAPVKAVPRPILLTGTIQGKWGFDDFTGPTVPIQQLPGGGWQIAPHEGSTGLIAGRAAELLITSTGSACVHTIVARPTGSSTDLPLTFKPAPTAENANLLAVTLPAGHSLRPGDLHVAIQQYGQPREDTIAARTFSEPAEISSIELHAGDKGMLVTGARLREIEKLSVGDLVFTPNASQDGAPDAALRLSLGANDAAPPTKVDDHLTAKVLLRDGRALNVPVTVSAARPTLTLLSKTAEPEAGSTITLTNPDDLALSSRLTFTLKTPGVFPRTGQIEIQTLDGTLRTVLTLAPSGGLLLQDPHTIVATLDPLRSFGPSAFGALHLRAVYPVVENARQRAAAANASEAAESSKTAEPAAPAPEPPSSDWVPLVTLVRLPTLTQIACPAEADEPCTLTGSSLFLIQAISVDPAFADPTAVPDGYTGGTLTLPHPAAAGMIFLKLRDDAAPIDSAIVPGPPAPAAAPVTKSRSSARGGAHSNS